MGFMDIGSPLAAGVHQNGFKRHEVIIVGQKLSVKLTTSMCSHSSPFLGGKVYCAHKRVLTSHGFPECDVIDRYTTSHTVSTPMTASDAM